MVLMCTSCVSTLTWHVSSAETPSEGSGTWHRVPRSPGVDEGTDRLDQPDPYKVLGVAYDADQDTIAAAHRALARRFHPDVSDKPDTQRRMAEINAAWTLLRDPVRRAQWDMANRPHAHPEADAGPGPGGPGPGAPRGVPPRPGTRPPPGSRPVWHRGPLGEGAAGPPPGAPSGSVLPFGRHVGWSLGEIARVDPGYLAWLKDRREGAPYRDEIERILASVRRGRHADASPQPQKRRFPFG